jgi:SNF2 family DNA or RNA helicase
MSEPTSLALRAYQEKSKAFLLSGRGLLGDEPGLGKTPPAILAARELVPNGDILVVGPKVAHGVWRRLVKQWVDEDVVLYTGQPGIRGGISLVGGGWYACSYHMLPEVYSRRKSWPLIIADESHHMANRKAGHYKAMRRMHSEAMFELTGSPMVNGLWDLWTQLNLLHPKTFSSYWRFVYEHVLVTKERFGWELGPPKNPSHTRAALKPYLLRRTKKSSGLDLPPKQRGIIEVEHTPRQQRIYNDLVKKMVAEFDDGTRIMTPSKMALVTRLRQCNISPALFGGPHESGAIDAVAGKLDELFDAGQHVIVFTPFTDSIPWMIESYKKLTSNMAVLIGGMSADAIDEVVDWFQNADLKRKLLFASIRAGTSWTATAASNCIFMGYDWTPMWNGQCEDRLHRFGQTSMVNAWYVVGRGTIDEYVLEVLDKKVSWNNLILNPEKLARPT